MITNVNQSYFDGYLIYHMLSFDFLIQNEKTTEFLVRKKYTFSGYGKLEW